MPVLVFDDPYITGGYGYRRAHQLLVCKGLEDEGSIEMVTFRCVDPRDPYSGILLEVHCSEEWMDWVTRKLQQIGDIARLAEMHSELMEMFLWKFSSPALTGRVFDHLRGLNMGQ